jgi:hypothetical protein
MNARYGKGLHSLHGCLEGGVGGRTNVGWRSDSLCVKEVEETQGALRYS